MTAPKVTVIFSNQATHEEFCTITGAGRHWQRRGSRIYVSLDEENTGAVECALRLGGKISRMVPPTRGY